MVFKIFVQSQKYSRASGQQYNFPLKKASWIHKKYISRFLYLICYIQISSCLYKGLHSYCLAFVSSIMESSLTILEKKS